MQLELLWFLAQLIELTVQIFAGAVVALFAVFFSQRQEKKARIKALREKLASEIILFQKVCYTFAEKTGRGPSNATVVKEMAIHTAQSIMDAFRVYPEAKKKLPWDLLVELADELLLLSVKGFGDAGGMTWFLDKTKELEQLAESVAERV